jgi:hypothetical protein
MKQLTFAEAFCSQHGLSKEEFNEAVFRRSLYPLARLLRPVLALLPGYFIADREFIAGAGHITRMRELDQDAFAFANHPSNRGVLRRVFRLRVSAGKMGSLVRSALREGSKQPFANPDPGAPSCSQPGSV